jgi:signal peptide peptidase SppA
MPAIMRAFAGRRLAAVALQINSPGGSAVQSALIAQHIRRLAERKKVPVYAFVEDVAASGGYWLALAADEIHADANSIVGSIGVIAAGFGLAGLIDKLGVERRVHTAGANKSFLDPFRPERPEDVERLLALQGEMHQRFVAWVKARRGDRLRTPDDAELFSGAFWTGATARDKGLIDGIGDMGEVLRARFGPQVAVRFVNLPRQGWLRRRLGLSGAALAEDVAIMLETRLARGRYGL